MEQFIGSAKVLDNIIEEGIVEYKLDNGLSQTATPDQFLAMVSETAYDDGEVSMRKWKPVIEGMIQLAVDNRATVQDWEWLLDRANDVVGKNYTAAMAKALEVAYPKQVGLQKIDDILKSK